MKTRHLTTGLFSVLAALALPASAMADTFLTTNASPVANGTYDTYGNEFTVGPSDLEITALGAFAGAFTTSVTVAGVTTTATSEDFTVDLYNASTKALLDSVVVPTGTLVDSQDVAYLPLATGYTLLSGGFYALADFIDAGTATSSNTPADDTNAVTVGSDVTLGTDIYNDNKTPISYPSGRGGFPTFFSANMKYTGAAAPEPSTWALIATGLVALAWIGRRKLAA